MRQPTLRRWWIESLYEDGWHRIIDVLAPSADAAAQEWIDTRPTRTFRVVKG